MDHRDSCDDLREVRWGVLGAGRISHRFASSLKEVDGARLVAAAGRTPSHVEEFCRAFSIDAVHSYATADDNGDAAYDALIADPDVDESTWLFHMACMRIGSVGHYARERPCCAKSRPF